MSESETLDFYGAPTASKRRRWGLVLTLPYDVPVWKAVAWFATRKRAEEYAREHHRREPFAIARASWPDSP